MGERVEIERDRRPAPPADRGMLGLVAIFLAVSIALFTRPMWAPQVRAGVVVEVRGDVAAPGTYTVDPPTVAAAVEAAGGPSDGLPEDPLRDGDAVIVGPSGVEVGRMADPMLVMLPVDVNTATPEALAAVPGVGPSLAARIVADRAEKGPFFGVAGLARVPGLSRRTVKEVEPFLAASGPKTAPPIDVNHADAAALERLPGIGPTLAARIVEDRTARGPFRSLDALTRVSGIGPSTVRGLGDRAVAGSAP